MNMIDRREVKGRGPQVYPSAQLPAGWQQRMTWLPVVILFITIVALAFMHIEVVWNPPYLLKFLNITFLTIITFLVSLLAARTYLENLSRFFLMMGCGMLALGLGGSLGALPLGRSGPNWTVTVYNLSAFLAGLCLFISAIDGWSVNPRVLRSGWPVLLTFYLGIMVIESILVLAVRSELLPIFFVDGHGATIYNLLTLWTTAGLFTASAFFLRINYGASKSKFYYWCTLGFVLIAIGLVGVSLQTRFGSPLNWASRFSQYLGGVYLLIATISSVRQGGSWMLPMERALRESQERYRALVESSPDGIIVHRNGRFLYANSVALKMYNADTLEQLQTRMVLDLIHPDDRAAIEARMQQALVEQRLPLRETRMMTLDGRVISVETVGSRVDFFGEPAVQIIIRDITERKRAEEALHKASERLKMAQLAARAGVWDWDKITGKIEWSPEMFSLFGLDSQSSVVSFDTWKAVLHPEDLEKAVSLIDKALKDHTFLNNEYRVIHPDGQIIWVNALGKGFYDDQGLAVRMSGICIDITKRKQAEVELQESRERFRFALETIHTGAWDLDLVDHSAFRSLEHDRIFGYSHLLPEWTYEMFLEHVFPEDRVMVDGKFRRAIENQSDWNFECRICRTDGQIRWIWAAGRHIQYATSGTKHRMAGIVQDITERKHAEEELLKHREKLEDLIKKRTFELEAKNIQLQDEINQRKQTEEEKESLENQLVQVQKMEALGRFAGGIAHDMNNILYPIIIETELLLEDTQPGTSIHFTLNQILKAARRQKSLIKQILQFSRRSEQLYSPMNVIPILEETMDFLSSSLPSTIKIKKNIDTPIDIILGDPTQIQQILMNLFRNAADAIGTRKGTIEVGLANTYLEPGNDVSDIKAGQYLELVVKDSGHGMRKEVMDRIFEPFYTTKEVGQGSGMGLAVVHGILKNHGGTITVESDEGKGSQFTVYLPISEERIETQVLPTDKDQPMNGKRNVLLVDDEEVILSSLQNALKRMGYNVIAAKDGAEAYQVFLKSPADFDLVITDLTMPQITGAELANRLLDIRSDIPIILCTGFNDMIDEEKAKSFGIRELLLKPASINELKNAIGRALDN